MPLPDLAAAPGPDLDLDLALASLGGETLRGEGAPPALPFFPLEEEEGAAVAAVVVVVVHVVLALGFFRADSLAST